MKSRSNVSSFIGIVVFFVSRCSSNESKITMRQDEPSQPISHSVDNGKLVFENKNVRPVMVLTAQPGLRMRLIFKQANWIVF